MFWILFRWLLRQSTVTWCVLLAACLGLGTLLYLEERPAPQPQYEVDTAGPQAAIDQLQACGPHSIVLTPLEGRYLHSGELDGLVESAFPGSTIRVKNGAATISIVDEERDGASLNFVPNAYLATHTRLAAFEMTCLDGTVVDLLAML